MTIRSSSPTLPAEVGNPRSRSDEGVYEERAAEVLESERSDLLGERTSKRRRAAVTRQGSGHAYLQSEAAPPT